MSEVSATACVSFDGVDYDDVEFSATFVPGAPSWRSRSCPMGEPGTSDDLDDIEVADDELPFDFGDLDEDAQDDVREALMGAS